MSFVILAVVAIAALVGIAVLVITLSKGGSADGAGTAREAPLQAARSRDVIFFLRFEGRDDETYVRDLSARHGQIHSATQAREAALDVVRAAPTATHAYCGPATAAPHGPGLAHTGLPGGVVLGFLVRGSKPLDTVADDSSLQSVVAELRKIAAWVDSDFAGADLKLAQVAIDAPAPPLVAVRKETRPGHQLCAYCGEAFLAHDTRCPNCGARVGA
ncbi:MAG: hypothetical protein H6721_01035 [Sandaracinus sp.]|nr:hypothetical protein [Sandaracinus sp.]MCB9630728.1 hypothetical protein [Sandaracinus sp.]